MLSNSDLDVFIGGDSQQPLSDRDRLLIRVETHFKDLVWSLELSDQALELAGLLFALAGSVVLVSVTLVALVSPWWLVLTAFVGVNLLVFVVSGACVASIVLQRVFGLEKGCAR